MEFLSDSESEALKVLREAVKDWELFKHYSPTFTPSDVRFLLRYIGELENFKWSMEH